MTTTTTKHIRLKKKEERRILSGHPWIYSNEIDTATTPLKSFTAGEEVIVETHDQKKIGAAYINPHSLIAGRIFSHNANDSMNLEFFKQRIQDAYALRQLLFDKPYYRMVFSEVDGLPGLIIDRFGDHIVLQINTAGMEQKKELVVQAIRELLPNTASILLRNDSKVRNSEGLETYVSAAFGEPPEEVLIEENNVSFNIPLWKGQKTGWFYDHRDNRARLQRYVVNHAVLDVFSYLGGWGIQAAVFGARKVDCIESSAFAADFIKRNADLNGVGDKVHVICDDAFDAMKKLFQEGKKYNVVILDPPAFVKKLKDRKEGIIAYQRINELALKLLTPGGILVTCSCSMHVSMEDLMTLLQRAAYRTQSTIQILERGHQAVDHPIHISIPETDYLKAIFVRKL